MSRQLPIERVLKRIVEATVEHGGAIVEAPPGAGKTTRVPVALAEHFACGVDSTEERRPARQVVVLEPRRLAARAAARRIAEELGVQVGGRRVGYRVRFDNCARADTAIVFVTPGVLLRWIQDDVGLEGVGCLIFDEFHERGLDSDLALALGQYLRSELRDDLALVVMSATLEGEQLARHLQLPQVVSEGRLHPVSLEHEERVDQRPLPVRAAAAVRRSMAGADERSGAILVFLPGLGEIRRVGRLLEEPASEFGWEVVELFGAQSLEQQESALRGPRRRVVLSTNLAESSVTVEGVTTVIDSGVHKLLRFDAARGVDRLVTEPIPVHSAEQRRGRAGRLEAGHCIRLWTRAAETQRRQAADAEVTRVDLTGAVLQAARLGLGLGELPWLLAPSEGRIAAAESVLGRLGALQDGALTETGDRLSRLPVAPRVGGLLLAGARHGLLQEAAWTAALLTERDPLAQRRGGVQHPEPRAAASSDLDERFEILRRRRRRAERGGSWATVERVAEQLLRSTKRSGPQDEGALSSVSEGAGDFGHVLVEAFPDRVALAVVGEAEDGGAWRARMVGGLGIVPGRSRVRQEGLLVVLDMDLTGASGRLALAHRVEREQLPSERVQRSVEVQWSKERQEVEAWRVDRFEDLDLHRHRLARQEVDARLLERMSDLLAEQASADPEEAFALDREPERTYLLRVRRLLQWAPELDIPSPEEQLQQLVDHLAGGRTSFAELRAQPVLDMLRGAWTHHHRTLLDEWVPERIQVPGGRHVPVLYDQDGPPVLAARIQELFGWRRAPRLAGGRQKLLLHLLAPSHRPAQITDDLEGFWTGSYQAVRKDLAGRYPKHDWPENPLDRV